MEVWKICFLVGLVILFIVLIWKFVAAVIDYNKYQKKEYNENRELAKEAKELEKTRGKN